MEDEMRNSLLQIAEAYASVRKISISTTARLAANDWRFFDRLKARETTFTARKFDDVMSWFHTNWPADVPWPANVNRPEQIAS